RQSEPDGRAVCVARRVTDRFLENQEYVPALLRIEFDLLEFGGRLQAPNDPFRAKHIRGELADTKDDVPQVIAQRIDGPYDPRHRSDDPARRVCYFGQDRTGFLLRSSNPALCDLAQDGHARKTRADVVMEVRGDAGADAFELEQACQAVAVDSI